MFKRILLTLDGSKMAEQALQLAVNHAKFFQSEVILFRVINPLTKSYRAGLGSISAIERAEENLRLMANEYLEEIAENLREDGLEVKVATQIGVPYKEIISFSNQNDIEMIVMCTRGESGFTRWLLGSITDHVIRGSHIPVFVVPAIDLNRNNA